MVIDISGAVFFLPFGGSKKRQMFGLAIAGRNGLSVEIHQILAGVDFFSGRSVHFCHIITD